MNSISKSFILLIFTFFVQIVYGNAMFAERWDLSGNNTSSVPLPIKTLYLVADSHRRIKSNRKQLKKTSQSFYLFLARALLLSTATPDRYTNKLHAELATLSSAGLTIGGLVLSVDWASVGAMCLLALGAWGLLQKKDQQK